jgi:hypothetical protein
VQNQDFKLGGGGGVEATLERTILKCVFKGKIMKQFSSDAHEKFKFT